MADQGKPELEALNSNAMLEALVALANEKSVFVSVTLIVAGQTVSGMLVGTRDYLSAFGTHFAANIDGLDGHAAIDLAASFDKLPIALTPIFLHLKDARIVTGGNSFIDCGPVPMRVRISDVSSLILGKVG